MTRPFDIIAQEDAPETRLEHVERAMVKMQGVVEFLDDPARPATRQMSRSLLAELKRERREIRRKLGVVP